MKKLILCFSILPFVFSYNSCTKDKTPVPVDCIQTDTINTYTRSVKEIFDDNCAVSGCHDAVTAFNGVRLDTYENSVNAAKTKLTFFCSIENTCTPFMPYLGDKLDDSLITKIELWKANCYAQ